MTPTTPAPADASAPLTWFPGLPGAHGYLVPRSALRAARAPSDSEDEDEDRPTIPCPPPPGGDEGPPTIPCPPPALAWGAA